jgi:hypothetical protein
VQKAMGFKYPARVEFDRMDLSNEEAEKALLIQLADRNIISDELLQQVFGFDPEMEKIRLNREAKDRETTKMVNKAGPFYNPQLEDNLKKIALQTGLATPSQVGLVLEKKKAGEKSLLELKMSNPSPQKVGLDKTPGQPQQGRPRNVKDSEQRKIKEFSPQTGAALQIWGIEAQDKIADILNPLLLSFFNKKNMRSLSQVEYNEAENIKTKIFLSLDPLSHVNEEIVLNKLNTVNSIDNNSIINTYQFFHKNLCSLMNRQLTIEECKYAKAYVYHLVYKENMTN